MRFEILEGHRDGADDIRFILLVLVIREEGLDS